MSIKRFISDHHFGHENIRKFEPIARPFNNAQEMGEWLVAQHNSVVKKRDKTIFLGDFAVGKNAKEHFLQFFPQMNGMKELVLGNHDDLPLEFYLSNFQKVYANLKIRHKGMNYWATHFPIHQHDLQFRCKGNIHGHLHSKTIDDKRYFNVCVEHCEGVPRTLDGIIK